MRTRKFFFIMILIWALSLMFLGYLYWLFSNKIIEMVFSR